MISTQIRERQGGVGRGPVERRKGQGTQAGCCKTCVIVSSLCPREEGHSLVNSERGAFVLGNEELYGCGEESLEVVGDRV